MKQNKDHPLDQCVIIQVCLMATEPGSSVQIQWISDCPSASGLAFTSLSAVHIQQQCESHRCQGEEDDDDDDQTRDYCPHVLIINHTACVNASAERDAEYGGHLHLCVPFITGFLFLIR